MKHTSHIVFLTILLQVLSITFEFSTTQAQTDPFTESMEHATKALQEKDFTSSIHYFQQARTLLGNQEHDGYAYCSSMLGLCYFMQEKYSMAIHYFEESYAIPSVSTETRNFTEDNLLELYLNRHDTINVQRIFRNAWKRFQQEIQSHEKWFSCPYMLQALLLLQKDEQIDSLAQVMPTLAVDETLLSDYNKLNLFTSKNSFFMVLGDYYMGKKAYRNAITYLQQALKYTNENETDKLYLFKTQIAECHMHLKDAGTAVRYAKEVVSALKKNQYAKETDFRTLYNSLVNLSTFYAKNNLFQESIQTLQEAEERCKTQGDFPKLLYCYATLYSNNDLIGNTKQAKKYEQLLCQQIHSIIHPDNASANSANIPNTHYEINFTDEELFVPLSVYSIILEGQGNIKEALQIYQLMMQQLTNLEVTDKRKWIECYQRIANIYFRRGNSTLANTYFSALRQLIATNELDTEDFIDANLLLIDAENRQGNVGKAISMGEALAPKTKQLEASSSTLHNFNCLMGLLYNHIGNNEKAIPFYEARKNFYLKKYGEKSRNYAFALQGLATLYNLCDRFEEALELAEEASAIIKRQDGTDNGIYLSILRSKATSYQYLNKEKETNNTLKTCLSLAAKVYGENSTAYATILINYASYRLNSYFTQKNQRIHVASSIYELEPAQLKDLQNIEKGLTILSQHSASEGLDYIFLLDTYRSINTFLNVDAKVYEVNKELLDTIRRFLAKNYHHLIDWQRESLGNTLQGIAYHSFPRIAARSSSANYTSLAYNACLLTKGLQLYSTNSISRMVREKGNTELKGLHQLILQKKEELQYVTDAMLFQQLQTEIHQLQRKEVEKIKAIGVFTDFLQLDYKDIQAALGKKDFAIEFTSYRIEDTTHYIALLVTPLLSYPLSVPLFTDKELNKFRLNHSTAFDYANKDLYQLIWGNLEHEVLHHAEKVYFSPSGILNKLAIENLCDQNGRLASEKWELYRVSSTREIVSRSKRMPYQHVVLYGGLTYDMSTDQLLQANARANANYTADRYITDQIIRNGASYLPGSLHEIMKIRSLLTKYEVDCTIYSGQRGTEMSFKQLPSKDIDIIHLATHGYYWENKNEKPTLSKMLNPKFRNQETNSLLNSGLLFSGVNCSLKGEKIPNHMDDGILTAREISLQDLSNIDFVVLSACQSALGDISEEGVYGLQRGFKLAGVNGILMSLWKIDDQATAMFMVEFYKNFMKGITKREALVLAQQKLRTTKRYHHPKYWAGFILLDGIDYIKNEIKK